MLSFLEDLPNQKSVPLLSLREKCPHSEYFWSAFSRICTEYEEIRSIPQRLKQDTNFSQNTIHIHTILVLFAMVDFILLQHG